MMRKILAFLILFFSILNAISAQEPITAKLAPNSIANTTPPQFNGGESDFYKYLSDKEIEFLKDNDYDDELLKTVTEDDPETVKWVQENIGYFISYKDFFSTWLGMGKDFDVSNVRDALSAFSRLISPTHKRVFEKIFNTLETGLSKLGDSSGTQTKAISGLLNLIKDIPMDGKQGYDVLGFI